MDRSRYLAGIEAGIPIGAAFGILVVSIVMWALDGSVVWVGAGSLSLVGIVAFFRLAHIEGKRDEKPDEDVEYI